MALASRFASVKPEYDGLYSSSIVLSNDDWAERDFGEVFSPKLYRDPGGATTEVPHAWELMTGRTVKPKNMPETAIREIVKTSMNIVFGTSLEQETRKVVEEIKNAGRYWPEPASHLG